jgi:hypothetical protein
MVEDESPPTNDLVHPLNLRVGPLHQNAAIWKIRRGQGHIGGTNLAPPVARCMQNVSPDGEGSGQLRRTGNNFGPLWVGKSQHGLLACPERKPAQDKTPLTQTDPDSPTPTLPSHRHTPRQGYEDCYALGDGIPPSRGQSLSSVSEPLSPLSFSQLSKCPRSELQRSDQLPLAELGHSGQLHRGHRGRHRACVPPFVSNCNIKYRRTYRLKITNLERPTLAPPSWKKRPTQISHLLTL